MISIATSRRHASWARICAEVWAQDQLTSEAAHLQPAMSLGDLSKGDAVGDARLDAARKANIARARELITVPMPELEPPPADASAEPVPPPIIARRALAAAAAC